ncbi:hypothetical protein KHQ81_00155 [Mycoplasmatota bacterium]|nr:hypothetical protein KHQ81_00155 [Mycoplasmatota bacterium]
MGAWGPKLYEDDVAIDIKDEFRNLLERGKTTEEATEILIRDNQDTIDDMDEGPIFWFALSDTQWNLGNLLPFVKEKAIEHFRNGSDLRR